MNPFDYRRAADSDTAVAMVSRQPKAVYLAGGTNLVDRMKLGVAVPDLLVDLSSLPLDGIEELPDGGLRIGATVRNSELAAHPLVRRRFPVLSEALLNGASAQLRNLATTGGNLLQRTRCVYFTDVTTNCNKRDPGTGCSARQGYARQAAILGASDACIAVHPSDLAVALSALDARVVVRSLQGERTLPLVDLHRLPADRPEQDTVLQHGDLITAIELPRRPWARRSTYRKVRDRASYAFALVSVAAAVELDETAEASPHTIRHIRLALGGVAHKPWRASAAESVLHGAPATVESFRRAAEAELAQARVLPDNAFKVPLARNLIVSVMRDLTSDSRATSELTFHD